MKTSPSLLETLIIVAFIYGIGYQTHAWKSQAEQIELKASLIHDLQQTEKRIYEQAFNAAVDLEMAIPNDCNFTDDPDLLRALNGLYGLEQSTVSPTAAGSTGAERTHR